jgi:hypothetical protein
MSIALMTAAWALDIPTGEKIVLLSLADNANDGGHCWPSMALIAKRSGMTTRGSQLIVQRLVLSGHLTRTEIPGKGCKYIVHPARGDGMGGYSPPEYHYVYRVEDADTGEFYVGARSCSCPIKDDGYSGSGAWVTIAKQRGANLIKTVLAVVASRPALGHAEYGAVSFALADPLCRNRRAAAPGSLGATGYQGTPEPRSPRTSFAPNETTPTPERRSDKSSGTTITKVKDKNPSPSPRLKAHGYSVAFEAWWIAYPRKTAKGDAAKAWGSARKRLGGNTSAESHLHRAAMSYAANAPPDQQYIPHPATWLNGSRYDDPIEDKRSTSQRMPSLAETRPAI